MKKRLLVNIGIVLLIGCLIACNKSNSEKNKKQTEEISTEVISQSQNDSENTTQSSTKATEEKTTEEVTTEKATQEATTEKETQESTTQASATEKATEKPTETIKPTEKVTQAQTEVTTQEKTEKQTQESTTASLQKPNLTDDELRKVLLEGYWYQWNPVPETYRVYKFNSDTTYIEKEITATGFVTEWESYGGKYSIDNGKLKDGPYYPSCSYYEYNGKYMFVQDDGWIENHPNDFFKRNEAGRILYFSPVELSTFTEVLEMSESYFLN